jgi:hypothetical protein
MIIPREFKLFGQTIKVKYSRTLMDKKNAFGLCDYNKNTITLQQSTRKNILTREQIEQTFLHEVLHMMTYKLGYPDLSDNETFIDSFAHLLHQVVIQIEND